MSRRILVSGSIAYDNIMVFEGKFKDHILPERVHMLSVSFLTPQLKREFGGCAANIGYNLRLLGGEPALLAAVGSDGGDYLKRLEAFGVDVSAVVRSDDVYTAQCFITTDLDANQFTAFHPGAMSQAHLSDVGKVLPAAFGIVGPNGYDAMMAHAKAFRENKLPFIFDPGQGLPMFDGPALRQMLDGASVITVNDYESTLLADKLGCPEAELASLAKVLIVTRGAEGSDLYVDGVKTVVPVAPISKAVDPTGCGDAYRGGLLYGLAMGWSWLKCARLGSVMGAIKIEHNGPQNHSPSREVIAQRYQQVFGETLFD